MRKGSITIFSLLTMMLVASVLFVLLEGSRFQEIRRISNLQTEVAVESAFANYNSLLWKEYKLLGCDYNALEEALIATGNARIVKTGNGINLLQSEIDEVTLCGYTRLTDAGGSAYIHAVSSSMQKLYFLDTAKEIFNRYEVIKDIKENSNWNISWIEEGLSLGTEAEENTVESNPMEEAQHLQSIGILELVVEDTESLSRASFQKADAVSCRALKESKNPMVYEVDWLDRILFQQYLLENMSNYCNKKQDRCLEYELEYIIGGTSSDIENLKTVVTQVLSIREMANFLYLMSDVTKVEEAQMLAITLAGVSVNPLIIETVKLGILTAWAFGESILDVRALLQGKKVPLLKSSDTWTLELADIGSLAEGYATAKESEWGMDYQAYLGILLLFHQETDMAMHAMDVQEAAVRRQQGDINFQMDDLLIHAEVEMQYRYSPVFLSFYQIATEVPWNYTIQTNKIYAYY